MVYAAIVLRSVDGVVVAPMASPVSHYKVVWGIMSAVMIYVVNQNAVI